MHIKGGYKLNVARLKPPKIIRCKTNRVICTLLPTIVMDTLNKRRGAVSDTDYRNPDSPHKLISSARTQSLQLYKKDSPASRDQYFPTKLSISFLFTAFQMKIYYCALSIRCSELIQSLVFAESNRQHC